MRETFFRKHGMADTVRALFTIFLAFTFVTCSGGGGGSAGTPSSFPPTISLTHFAGGFTRPVAITHAGDGSGRLFIAEQGGLIRILSSGVVAPVSFLDSSNLVMPAGGEQGLLGLAFPPGFNARRSFYVNYTNRTGIGNTVYAAFDFDLRRR